MRRLLLALAVAGAGVALAQQRPGGAAVERFHGAARLFIEGDTSAAAREARAGLRVAPDDPALTALLDEILRRPPPQPPSGGGGPPPPEQPPPTDGDDGEPREEDPSEQEDPADQDPSGRPERPDPQGADSDRDGDPVSSPPPDAAGDVRPPRDAVRMTREEAEALLRALGADERRLLRTRRQQGESRRFENDW